MSSGSMGMRTRSTRRKRKLSTEEEIVNCVFEHSQEQQDEAIQHVIREFVGEPPSHVLGLVQNVQPVPIVSETCGVEESPEIDGILFCPSIGAVVEPNATTNQTDPTCSIAGSVETILITLDGAGQPPAKIPKPDFLGRGRTLDNVWSNFHRSESQPPSKITCNHCDTSVSSRVERLRKHMETCKGPSVSGSESVPDVPQSGKHRFPLKQTKLSSYVDIVTKEEKNVLDYEVGKYIYSMNLPFSHVDHPRFLKMATTFRPGYKPPTRQTIGSTILNNVYDEVVTEIKGKICGKEVTLMQDGWKSKSQESIIAHCITTGEHAYLLNAISAEENEKTSKYCAGLLLDAIKLAEERFNVDVIGVVTDNCNSMRKMRNLLVEEKPEILTYGCHPHLLNLIGKKLTPEHLQTKVEIVHKFFRNHDAAGALLKKIKGTRPVIASTTRWNSWIRCFESYLKNQTKFLEISRSPEARMSEEEGVIDVLNDRTLYIEIEQTVGYLKPIQLALDKLQSQTSTLADGVSAWLDLRNQLVILNLEQKRYFEKQFERAVTDVGIAAYMLHPKFRGKGLSSDLVDMGHAFLTSKAPFAIIIASQIQLQSSSYFSHTLLSDVVINGCTALEWWQSVQTSGKVPKSVAELAITLMKLPAGSADIERHFSTLGNIINERRTRLGINKAEKLCLIYKHLAGNCTPVD